MTVPEGVPALSVLIVPEGVPAETLLSVPAGVPAVIAALTAVAPSAASRLCLCCSVPPMPPGSTPADHPWINRSRRSGVLFVPSQSAQPTGTLASNPDHMTITPAGMIASDGVLAAGSDRFDFGVLTMAPTSVACSWRRTMVLPAGTCGSAPARRVAGLLGTWSVPALDRREGRQAIAGVGWTSLGTRTKSNALVHARGARVRPFVGRGGRATRVEGGRIVPRGGRVRTDFVVAHGQAMSGGFQCRKRDIQARRRRCHHGDIGCMPGL